MKPSQARPETISVAPSRPLFWKPLVLPLVLLLVAACTLVLCPTRAEAQTSPTMTHRQRVIAGLDQLLASVQPGQKTVYVDDMGLSVEKLRAYRDRLRTNTRSSFAETWDGEVVNLWTSGTVYYSYADGLEDWKKTLFEQAIVVWEDVADLNFVVRTSQTNYILVKDGGDVMNSDVGMVGGQQTLNFADWGTKWNAAHELGHALGLLHEHMRSDRETYVDILYQNIIDSKEFNFTLMSDSNNFGPYDFDSLMHYSQTAFSVSGIL